MKVKEESEKPGLKLNIQKTKIMVSSPITSWQINGETVETVADYFSELQNHCRWWLQPWNYKTLTPWKESYDHLWWHIQKQRHYFANKGLFSQSYGFSSGHEQMWESHCKGSWALKNSCFWICCSRFVIAFLPRSKHLLISWLQSPSAVILEPKKIKSVTVSIFSPSIWHEVN